MFFLTVRPRCQLVFSGGEGRGTYSPPGSSQQGKHGDRQLGHKYWHSETKCRSSRSRMVPKIYTNILTLFSRRMNSLSVKN